ncbi:hypothetical protein K504DRAFT_27668 [Pleomassaria siparia CBS 279.74]|uniref:Uncharacterized protein n=1 Tax=Pleomassaria siparia CBS 279.74 TaxID=1314801 RepID=A0A6G1KRF7_9PLEO|nr:hypothetical protein K504DRAFT_27668 [Pleomassaria siparia CBS 279.74]
MTGIPTKPFFRHSHDSRADDISMWMGDSCYNKTAPCLEPSVSRHVIMYAVINWNPDLETSPAPSYTVRLGNTRTNEALRRHKAAGVAELELKHHQLQHPIPMPHLVLAPSLRWGRELASECGLHKTQFRCLHIGSCLFLFDAAAHPLGISVSSKEF